MNSVIKNLIKPIVKWSGGKGDELEKILPYIPDNYDTYLEPFVGGGAVFFHVNPEKAVINDVHNELIDFYKSIKSVILMKFIVLWNNIQTKKKRIIKFAKQNQKLNLTMLNDFIILEKHVIGVCCVIIKKVNSIFLMEDTKHAILKI